MQTAGRANMFKARALRVDKIYDVDAVASHTDERFANGSQGQD
jgi:hypothetical protein